LEKKFFAYDKDTPHDLYWERILRKAAVLLADYFEELRTKIVNSSKRDPWYLYFHGRALTVREYYALRILDAGFLRFYEANSEDEELISIFHDFHYTLERVGRKFYNAKHYNFFSYSLLPPNDLSRGMKLMHPRSMASREDTFPVLEKLIRQKYSLRFETPRKVKRQEFRRGYHDKGSASSVSTRARRQATKDSSIPDPHYGDSTTSENFPIIFPIYDLMHRDWRTRSSGVKRPAPLPNLELEEAKKISRRVRHRYKSLLRKAYNENSYDEGDPFGDFL
jgi:hypothetical protein